MAEVVKIATREDIHELKEMISTLFENVNTLVVAHATCQTLTQQRIVVLEDHAKVIKGNGSPGILELVRETRRVQEAHGASIQLLMDWYSAVSLWVKRKMEEGDAVRMSFFQNAARWVMLAVSTGISLVALYCSQHGVKP